MISIDEVYAQVAEMAARVGARRVILFGSRARGDNMPKSDIDLAVEGCGDFLALERMLQDDLWSLLKVDIVNLDEPVSDALRAEIARDGVVLYEEIR